MINFFYFIFFSYFSLFTLFGKEQDDKIFQNDFIITGFLGNDTIKTEAELILRKMKFNSFNVIVKTEDDNKFKYIANLLDSCDRLLIVANLNDKKFEEFIDELYITNKSTLNDLIIYNHNITKLPLKIKFFSYLETLSINTKGIKKFPNLIYELKNLVALCFGVCKFRELPNGISKLTSLKYLEFNNCKIRTINNDFENLKEIKEIKFYWCENLDLQNIFDVCSQSESKINKIDISYCSIKRIPDNIGLLENVDFIRLSWNRIKNKEKERIKNKFKNLNIQF